MEPHSKMNKCLKGGGMFSLTFSYSINIRVIYLFIYLLTLFIIYRFIYAGIY